MKKTKYVPMPGARIGKKAAQFVGEIAAKHGGLQGEDAPRALIAASRDSKSPTFRYFNKSQRAKAFERDLTVARSLIARVTVFRVVNEPAEAPRAIRAFHNVRGKKDEPVGYFETSVAAGDAKLSERVIAQFVQQLKSLRARFGKFRETRDACDVAIRHMQRHGKTRGRKAS